MNQQPGNGALATLKHRLQAWWSGEDEAVPAAEAAPADTGGAAAAEADEVQDGPGAPRGWSAARIDLVQRLFGPGCHRPLNPARLQPLLTPLALSRKSAVLVLGAGLGAGARLAGATGAHVTAIEANPQLAAAANRTAESAEAAQAGAVSHGDYEKIKIQPATLDGVIVPESLHPVSNRSRVLFNARKMLKLSGKLVMVDYFRRCAVDNPNSLVWTSLEGIEMPLQTPDEFRKELIDIGFEIDSFDDITAEYRHWVLEAFNSHAAYLSQNPANEDLRRLTLAEGELWTRRLGLMASGDLAVLRIAATVPWRG
jgi:ubiquinone/menaquinone biosynthesis C-methylase UbiE